VSVGLDMSTRGRCTRRELAACTWLPTISPNEIKRLNHLPLSDLLNASIDTEAELSRALLVSDAVSSSKDYELHYAGDLFDVFSNVQRWNTELATDRGKDLWGKRTIKYFVFDSATNQFAPSKFCAYINASSQDDQGLSVSDAR
jgi:hypothetical protein